MAGPSFDIRSATPDESHQAVSTVVAAFITDPMARFGWRLVHDYLRVMPLVVREFAGAAFEHRSAYVSDDLCGAALWLPPGVQPNGDALEQISRDTADPARLGDVLATFERMTALHSDEPHWYLPLIGVEPNAQGRGIGGALMRHAAARFDAEGVVAYLESSNPRNIPLYERHGFEVMGRIQVGAAPVLTPMLRRPRTR
jgi:ribosomal protein S18 acetylase RimI-like enzyme